MREIIPQVSKQIITYGQDASASVRAENVVAADGQMKFDCVRVNGSTSRFPVTLNLPGMHNVLNALAAIAVASEVGISDGDIIKALDEFTGAVSYTHLAGEKHLEQLEKNYAEAGIQAHCVAFIDNMAGAYEWADLVICRAGALTIAELSAAGVASILVPFPHAVDDHQTSNAKFLASSGGAILLPQTEMTPESISLIPVSYTHLDVYKRQGHP